MFQIKPPRRGSVNNADNNSLLVQLREAAERQRLVEVEIHIRDSNAACEMARRSGTR